MDIVITDELVGRTVLSYLKFTLRISSGMITALKKDEHGIEVNGNHVTVRYVLQKGDTLSINEHDSDENASDNIVPTALPLNIVYEDDNIIILDKPPNMPTHPSHNHYTDTLANALAYRYMTDGKPFVFRPMGRLDRNTSGLVIVAKNRASASYLYNAKIQGNIEKTYIALLDGELPINNEEITIQTYIRRQSESIIMRTCCDANEPGASIAITKYLVLYSGHGISMVQATPITGRTHQLRVHFSHIGNPILGDDIYGQESSDISRHALHASSLSLPIPFSGEKFKVSSPPPEDMQYIFKKNTGLELVSIIKGDQNEKK